MQRNCLPLAARKHLRQTNLGSEVQVWTKIRSFFDEDFFFFFFSILQRVRRPRKFRPVAKL